MSNTRTVRGPRARELEACSAHEEKRPQVPGRDDAAEHEKQQGAKHKALDNLGELLVALAVLLGILFLRRLLVCLSVAAV